MENLIKDPTTQMMTTQVGPRGTDAPEIDMPSKTSRRGHLNGYDLTLGEEGTKVSCKNL